MSLRARLVVFLESLELDGELHEDTSLIRSGLCDSLALVALAAWIEQEIGTPMDFATFDLARAWDTIPDILNFIDTCRRNNASVDGGAPY